MRSPASFRDPDGWVFFRDGVVFRQVNRAYQPHYDRLLSSGLYDALVKADLLVRHEEAPDAAQSPDEAYRVLKPERIPFISYPWEWAFSSFKAQAAALLRIQRVAIEHGMTLKDASAFNMQFLRGKPVLIDTSSFEIHAEGAPWVAYRQFCQHFLAPLLLMAKQDIRLGQLLRTNLDGVPLDLAARLLPLCTRLRPSVMSHVVLHAWFQGHYAGDTKTHARPMSRYALLGLIDSLESAVTALDWTPPKTVWSDYYAHTNYTAEGLAHKRTLVEGFLERVRPASVWDLGASTGMFSRLSSARGVPTVAFDMDPAAVEVNYRDAVARGDAWLLPLVTDLTNPSPACGWAGRERQSLRERGPADAALALALIHHLAIGANVPLDRIAETFADLCRDLVIEFVPKDDTQVQRLLATRRDVFPDYTQAGFEAAFAARFDFLDAQPVKDSSRRLYLMRRRTA